MTTLEGIIQRLMIGEDCEGPAFDEIAEEGHGKINGKQLSTEHTVACFGNSETPEEKGKRRPAVIEPLLEYGANSGTVCVGYQHEWGIWFWMDQESGVR